MKIKIKAGAEIYDKDYKTVINIFPKDITIFRCKKVGNYYNISTYGNDVFVHKSNVEELGE